MKKSGRRPTAWAPHQEESLRKMLLANISIREIATALDMGRMRVWNKMRTEKFMKLRPPKKTVYTHRGLGSLLAVAPPIAGRPMEENDLVEADEKWAALFTASSTKSYTSIKTTSLYQYREEQRERYV